MYLGGLTFSNRLIVVLTSSLKTCCKNEDNIEGYNDYESDAHGDDDGGAHDEEVGRLSLLNELSRNLLFAPPVPIKACLAH